ncbi:hypothetical protein Q766_00350 [Flavobacterium subsaxonicum WB 4.1-42 = DSM 21790]|uniref:Uncharacterized protein n=1 Tax=Flavobacterium subsaxonicum WB 4.1-42 = DSM 21790 TaxID=1121898 RepID=A0A0A2MQL6_9FLAO|nr:hypothetical protein Q766_00350 [Flavobacterium subsaxonicum WB 4.1-42 = DSM 21790]
MNRTRNSYLMNKYILLLLMFIQNIMELAHLTMQIILLVKRVFWALWVYQNIFFQVFNCSMWT